MKFLYLICFIVSITFSACREDPCEMVYNNEALCFDFDPDFPIQIERIKYFTKNNQGNNISMVLTYDEIDKLLYPFDSMYFEIFDDYSYEFYIQSEYSTIFNADTLIHQEKGVLMNQINEPTLQKCKFYTTDRNFTFIREDGRTQNYKPNTGCDDIHMKFHTVTANNDSIHFSILFDI